MSTLTSHPKKQGITYFEHLVFAMGIAWRLSSSVAVFALHGLLPAVSIEPRLDLEATSAFLLKRNHFIETAASKAHDQRNAGRRQSTSGHQDTPAMA